MVRMQKDVPARIKMAMQRRNAQNSLFRWLSIGVGLVAVLGLTSWVFSTETPKPSAPRAGAITHNKTRNGATTALLRLKEQRDKETWSQDSELGIRIIQQLKHDPLAFTQGLEFYDGKFLESTGTPGAGSSLRLVAIESGDVLRKKMLPSPHFGEGSTVLNGKIFVLTWQTHTCYVYDLEKWEELRTFHYKTPGWGLTHDHRDLIMSDGSDKIVFRDPNTFEILRTLQVKDPTTNQKVARLNELEYIHGEIWANIWFLDKIARIDPSSGLVVGWIDLRGLYPNRPLINRNEDVLNGIAYDSATDRLWVTGKLWPSMFEIELVDKKASK